MPQAPDLAPDLAPSTQGVAGPNLAVPTDAFGGAVGKALEGLGTTVEASSDRIWQRAMDMQNLQNEADVDRGDADFMQKAAMLHAEYGAKQGVEAQQALPKYIKDLQDAREGIRQGLSNPMSQKMFDRTSLSTMGRTIFNGAGEAAVQSKNAAIDAVTQRIKTTADFAANSGNPEEVTAAKQKLSGLNWKLHNLKGTPESVDDTEHVINSSLDSNVIIQNAKTDPFSAKEDLERKRKTLTEEDYNKADAFITSQRRAIGSANTANEIWDSAHKDADEPEPSEDAMVAAGKLRAAQDAPDDPIYAQHVESAIRTKFLREKQASRQFQWDSKQEIATAIQNGATSTQDILANPKSAAAYHGLTPQEQNAVPGQINRYTRAKDYAANQQSMTTLTGLRNNDVEAFLNTDPTDPKLKLSQPQIRTVMGWQAEDKKNQNQDPRVNRAMQWLRGSSGAQLQALSIYHRDAKDPEDYDRFTGALSEALTAWQDSHGKPAESKDVTDTIAPQLLKTHLTPGLFFGTNTSDPEFKDVISSPKFKQFSVEHAKSRTDQGLPPPTEQETERLYYRGMAQTLYSKKPTQ